MDASATLVTVSQLSVSMPFDDKYVIELDETDSASLIGAFSVAGEGATFTVTRDETALATILKKVIDEGTKGAEGKNLPTELADDMKERFQEYFSNGLSNILEDVHLSYEVKSQEGADSLSGLLNAQACEIIAQQIPQTNYDAWSDASENYLGSQLPLLDGNELVFIFNVASSLVVNRAEQKSTGVSADSSASATVSNVAAGAGDGEGRPFTTSEPGTATYTYDTRKIAYFVKVTGCTAAAAAAKAAAPATGGA
jgi:hypothetical protein